MKSGSLLFRFGIMFMLFIAIMLSMSATAMYFYQNKSYKEERKISLQQVSSYLEDILSVDGQDFVWYQDYFLSHSDTLLVSHDFSLSEVLESRRKFEKIMALENPGKTLGSDISFQELSEEAKAAFTVYKHEYYLYQFEQAGKKFELTYLEYVVPKTETLEIIYTLDSMRDERIVDGKKYIELAITVKHPVEEHKNEWQAWNTGKRVSLYDTFDNEYGRTYAFYSPLIIKGQKLGLIGVEVEIAAVNKAILHNTLRQTGTIAVVLIACVTFLLLFIYKKYISKLEHLQKNIGDYTLKKNANIVREIEQAANGKDEISVLAQQFSSMVLELENYMKTLVATTKELKDTREQSIALGELATKDALTGIRNKTAYDKEVSRLEWAIAEETAKFGIVMVDLNFLKRINDTFGHEHGNIAIRSLCYIVCHVFDHSPVFRIGGDEFVVILEKEDYENIEHLVEDFNARLDAISKDDNLEQWERVSAALGYALYDSSVDASVANVFKRADKAMYARKREMKAIREN